jgi:diguanylate cyclase (GGDEF)-like protein
VVNVARDVTAQRETEERLRNADKIDVLTNVWTRREFKSRLRGSIARASVENQSVGVLIADLDHFKHVNDIFGDPAGDHLLRAVCDRIRSVLPPEAYVARLGGDEFAIAVPGIRDEAQLLWLANEMLRQVDAPVPYEGLTLRGALSIGCAMYPRDAADMSGLLKCADAALSDLKDGGRGRAQAFTQRMLDDATQVAEQLRTAWDVVRRGVIVPYYQAKVRLDDRRIVGLEALLRWRDNDGTLRYPGRIAEAFNNFDLATRIADAMQEKVLSDVAGWLRAGLPVVPVSINAAPVEFLRGDYAERLLGRLARFGVPASLIEVEVTEHSLTARSAKEVAHALRTLTAAGVRIALDDFGAGHSSLIHLRDYSINVLKIDRNFVAGMMVDPPMAAIVETICGLAPRLGLEVVAEGVETEAQADKLQPWGCRIGQGFLFGEALSADLTIERLGQT